MSEREDSVLAVLRAMPVGQHSVAEVHEACSTQGMGLTHTQVQAVLTQLKYKQPPVIRWGRGKYSAV